MKQLSLFETRSSQKISLYVDGAARGNPGPAGIGIYLLEDKQVIEKRGFFLGATTNNQAEYLALIAGLLYALQHKDEQADRPEITIYTDSQLLARQITGEYRVRKPELIALYKKAYALLQQFRYTIVHIYREHNTEADKLANDGINKKRPLPNDIQQYLFS